MLGVLALAGCLAASLPGAPTGFVLAQESRRPEGKIVVPRGRELVVVLPATGAEERVATAAEGAVLLDAALAPDGGRAAYASLIPPSRGDLGGSDLYTLPARGGDAALIAGHDVPGATLTNPAFSADGSSILYTYTPYVLGASGPDALPRIERVAVAGGQASTLLREASSPAPSADGRRLAYLKSSNRGDALWLANADGTEGRELVPATRFLGIAYPRIAPDGRQIAIAATIDLPSSPAPTVPRSPFAWQPADRAASHGLPWDVWLVDVESGGLRRLTNMVEDDPSLAWSPDGRWIAVQGGYGLTLVDASSGRTERLSQAVAFGAIDWARD